MGVILLRQHNEERYQSVEGYIFCAEHHSAAAIVRPLIIPRYIEDRHLFLLFMPPTQQQLRCGFI